MKKYIIVLSFIACVFLWGCRPAQKIIVPQNANQASQYNKAAEKSQAVVPNTDKSPSPDAAVPKAAPSPPPVAASPKTEAPPAKTPVKAQTSSAAYSVEVKISEQKVYVYKGNETVRAMICSTGIKGSETPTGNFKINHRDTWFFSKEFMEGGKYWVGFIGYEYLFHSVPLDEHQNIIQEEAKKLGSPASHGCVRLSMDDAYWFYKTIPDGTNVLIQN